MVINKFQSINGHKNLKMIDTEKPIKLLLVGDSAVGKTCLVERFCDDKFDSFSMMTVGVDFKIKIVNVDGFKSKLQIWDSAGPERFRSISSSYIRGSHGVIIVCDITNKESFDSIDFWINCINSQSSKIGVVLVGNKYDYEQRQISKNEAKEIALKYGLHYFEASAKTGKGVDEVFNYIESLAYHMRMENENK